MKKYWLLFVLHLMVLMWTGALTVDAHVMEAAGITMSPDGNAFTTNAGDTNTKWYERGYEVKTGITGTLRQPETGEHLYVVERTDAVPVLKWVVSLPTGRCQHDIYPEGDLYHGVSYGRKKCLSAYYSGWFAYCADCNEQIVDKYFYMSEGVAKGLKYLDMSKSYYYKCPHCDNLEQGMALNTHVCKEVSDNRYFVRYHANFGSGYMEKSSHMVNNSTKYEGREVTPQTTLNLNTFTRVGYEFAGWNTKKDGSGTSYSDGATIYNLSMEENSSVILYAQWKKSNSTLEIDPSGGSYNGRKDIIRISGEYASEYNVDLAALAAPTGYKVHFNTMGGSEISDMTGAQAFLEWSYSRPFYGRFEEGIYRFLGRDGSVDRITAVYNLQPIVLPKAVREGYSFGGWFSDRECTIPVGGAGDCLVPQKEMTLYAGWVDLQLIAKDNYTANAGKGAVNLSWVQKDEQSKVYEVYQKTDSTDWIRISSIEENVESFEVSKIVNFSGDTGSYTVPYTGFYTLTLTGAQGENYGTYNGGKGGRVQATVYLEKGEKLNYTIGGQNGYSGGGSGKTYGGGGGCSMVSTERLGTIMVAGGGGGASGMENGGAGGSSAQVMESGNGQSGETGGGGGYLGGASGEVKIHQHIDQCRHTHIGNPNEYGGCYTRPTKCGSDDIEFKVTHTTFYYGNISDDGKHQYCVRCASDDCPGHLDKHGIYTCNNCGNQVNYPIQECTAMKIYELSCDRDENYICGMDEGELISSKPAYGGSSYINADSCIDYKEEAGVQSGDGKLSIVSKQVGLLDAKELNGVTATDRAAPEIIDENSIVKTAVDEDEIRVAFSRPIDNGTSYYHQVKSLDKGNMDLMCESNVTINTLTSQIAGYRYLVDSLKDTQVNNDHSFYEEKGENPFLIIEVENSTKYLHIAAEDIAGNVGATTHIKISEEEVVYWPLLTEQLLIEESENISPTDEADTYYVRADDSTPIQLTLEGLLCGTARKGYQIDEADFVVQSISVNAEAGIFSVIVPGRDKILAGTFTYPTDALLKRQSGVLGIRDASFTMAKRFNFCKGLLVEQKFTVPGSYDGQTIRVMPRVAAAGEKETIYSKEENDLLNSIYLIADGTGPVIKGMKQLDNLDMIEYSGGKTLEIELTAEDFGSGLGQFYVEIRNQDNGFVVRYEDTELSGRISFVIRDEEQVFNGQFSVLVYAEDKVGNESTAENELLGVGLDAYVERVLEPHTPRFKKGESGKLYVKTWGYVERLEISFPTPFVDEDPTLERVIVYDIPDYIQTEEISFMVPLSIPEGEMTIRVKAFKVGTQLEAEPKLITIKVKGSILDELRTRLR